MNVCQVLTGLPIYHKVSFLKVGTVSMLNFLNSFSIANIDKR
jgi:hypothetical protein